MIFSNDELYIILKCRNLEICKHSKKFKETVITRIIIFASLFSINI